MEKIFDVLYLTSRFSGRRIEIPGRGGVSAAMRARPMLRGLLGAIILLLGAAGCATVPSTPIAVTGMPADRADRAAQNLKVFHAVWDLVNRKHYDPNHHGVDWEQAAAIHGPQAVAASDDAALYRVLNTLVGTLRDSHTRALRPVQVTERRTEVRVRTGFNLARIEERWVVSEVLPQSPAEVAGVRAGWLAVARNGELLGERIDFRPREGETATWDFIDENDQPRSLAPPAARLPIGPRQIQRELGGGLIYLRFDRFDRDARRWLRRMMQQYQDAPGLVIDLRRNPGGETFSLGVVIGEFFDRRVDCGTFVGRRGTRVTKYSWQFGSARYAGKVAILVDTGTGSAAEIFSAVLQDHGRAVVVGRKTAGAVLASRYHRLPDGGELQLSRENYFTPKGRRIEGEGVEPDLEVTRTLADMRAGRDPELETALEELRRGMTDGGSND